MNELLRELKFLMNFHFQHFLETLEPFPGQSINDIDDQLYAESLRIEPRNCKQPIKFVSSSFCPKTLP